MNAPPRRKRLEKRELSMPRTLEPYQMIERSIIKKYRDELWKPFVYAVKKYELIQAGDKIAVHLRRQGLDADGKAHAGASSPQRRAV